MFLTNLDVVPVAVDPDEPEDEPARAFTDEQRERLRKSIDSLSRAVAPIDFKFQNLLSPAITKLVADMVKLPTFTLPDSLLKSLTATTRLSALATSAQLSATNSLKPFLDSQAAIKQFLDQQASVAAALKPFLDQQALANQFSVINSDLFKNTVLGQQSTLNAITAQITKNIDFGLGGSFAKLAQQIADQQSAWLKNLGPNLDWLKGAFYPQNLRDIDDLHLEEVEQVVMVDGIALYAVPRAAIAEALIRAGGAAKRRDILGRRWKAIATDCRQSVIGCTTATVKPYVSVTLAALDALEAGHVEAAQALVGSLLDSVVNSYFGKDRYLYTPNTRTPTNAAFEEFGVREYIAFAPVWQAWQKFFPKDGLPVPYTFSRNATAHTVSPKQYTRRNAVQGLMIASGILVFLDEQAARAERRREKRAA